MAIDVDAPAQTVSQSPKPGRIWAILVAGLVGLAAGSTVTWWVVHPRASDWFPVQVLEGNAYFNDTHTAFALPAEGTPQFFAKVGDAEGRECVPPSSPTNPQTMFMDIRIGVVRAAPTTHQVGREMVVWIRCLGPPRAP